MELVIPDAVTRRLEVKGMECAQCGTNNDDNASFCKGCGSPLSAAESPAAGSEAPRENRPARTFAEGASFFVAILSSIAAMFSYFLPWVVVYVDGGIDRYKEMIWYWPFALGDTSVIGALVLLGFNLLPIILVVSFAIMTSLLMRRGKIGKGFFHASLFMAVYFSFFVAGCLDFMGYLAGPAGELWHNRLGPGYGPITVTVQIGVGFLSILAAAVGYIVSASLCGLSLLRRRVMTVRTAAASSVLSFVACLGAYIILWSILAFEF